MVRRRAGRRRRPAPVLGGAERRAQRRRTRSSTPTARPPRPTRTATRSSSAPTAPRSRRRRRGVRARSTRRPARCSRATPTRSPPASRSTPSSDGLTLVTQFPVISEDGLAVTIDVRRVLRRLPDRRRSGRRPCRPTSSAGRALGIEDPAEAKQALIDAFTNDDARGAQADRRVLEHRLRRHQPAGRSGPLPERRPVHPHGVRRAEPDDVRGQPETTRGARSRRSQTIVYRIIGDPTAAVQAMENEEIDIIQPQATATSSPSSRRWPTAASRWRPATAAPTSTSTSSFNNGGPFDPATYGGDEATALAVRQAFLKTIPRQEIVDRLIVPLNPDADAPQLVHHRCPGAPSYDAIVAEQRLGRRTPRSTSRAPRRCSRRPASRRRSTCASTTPPTTRGVPTSTS